jgi:hypothetical protein
MDVDLALRQIQTGWNFLKLIFCKDIVAAEGYHYREKVLKMHRFRFAGGLDSGKLFLMIYVHLLESLFQITTE